MPSSRVVCPTAGRVGSAALIISRNPEIAPTDLEGQPTPSGRWWYSRDLKQAG